MQKNSATKALRHANRMKSLHTDAFACLPADRRQLPLFPFLRDSLARKVQLGATHTEPPANGFPSAQGAVALSRPQDREVANLSAVERRKNFAFPLHFPSFPGFLTR
jgi:hypothetical protein